MEDLKYKSLLKISEIMKSAKSVVQTLKHTLNVRGYEKGVYIYQLKDEKGNIHSGRLLIM